ncbi:MAG: hypothetical protein K2X09_07315, partial [Rickettsiales bacterium]|nr:hypothetical protein [Rickettsiales bacterium]
RPGKQEGRIVDASNRSATVDGTSSLLETLQIPFLGGTPGGLITLTRGKPGHEIEFERGQHYLRDSNGNPVAPNPKNRRKLESGFELERNAEGAIVTTQAMLAQISDNRRKNPDYKGVFGLVGLREADTAHNLNRPLTNTGEGMQWMATYMGAEKWYEKTDTAFKQAPDAATAEKMLQLNVQMAMHPLIWSKDSYGVPAKKIAAFRSEMQRVVDALPEGADKTRLTSTYITPYSALMDDNVKLAAAIKQNGGRAGWVNPMRDWADERLEDRKVVRDFAKVPLTEEVREQVRLHPENRYEIIRDFRKAEAKRFGYLAADQSWQESTRTATFKEAQLGQGMLNDAKGQKEENLAPARIEFLQHLRDNPQARAAWMNHMLATPGGFQNVVDTINLTSNRATGNYQLLGYPDPQTAREDAREIATGFAGEKLGKRILHRNGGFFESLGNGLVRFATIGLESDALGIQRRNLDRGQFGFREATAKRWNDSATHAEVDASLVKFLDGAVLAAKTGTPAGQIAATGVVLTADPDRAENLGAQQTFNAMADTLKPQHLKTIDNQMVANLDNAGKRYVTAALDKAIKAGILDGEKVIVVTEEQAIAAQNNGGVVALTAEQKASLGKVPAGTTVYYTTASQAAALAAAKAGNVSSALRAQIVNTSDDPSKVSQNQMNASSLTRIAAASPEAFTSVVTNAILAA